MHDDRFRTGEKVILMGSYIRPTIEFVEKEYKNGNVVLKDKTSFGAKQQYDGRHGSPTGSVWNRHSGKIIKFDQEKYEKLLQPYLLKDAKKRFEKLSEDLIVNCKDIDVVQAQIKHMTQVVKDFKEKAAENG